MEKKEMKDIWYDFVMNNKYLWSQKFTIRRLEKVRSKVFLNESIMWDLLLRHGANKETPEEMKQNDKECYDHCMGNFVCNILWQMYDEKIIKM